MGGSLAGAPFIELLALFTCSRRHPEAHVVAAMTLHGFVMAVTSQHPMDYAMATKKIKTAPRKTLAAVPYQSTASDHLHALLHTVRCIAQYEDVLCEITHEAKRTGELSPKLNRELGKLLDKIPSEAYVSDLNAVRTVLNTAQLPAKAKSTKSDGSASSRKPLAVKQPRKISGR